MGEIVGRIILALAVLTAGAFASPVLAIGPVLGGGSYGHGIGTGNGAGNATAPNIDDYATGRRLIHFEKYAEAVPFLKRAHNERPHDADVLAYLGYAEYMAGDGDDALDAYQAALTEDPDHKSAHEYLGELYLAKNNLAAARIQLAELVRICPSSCDERDALTKAIAASQPAAAPLTSAATKQ